MTSRCPFSLTILLFWDSAIVQMVHKTRIPDRKFTAQVRVHFTLEKLYFIIANQSGKTETVFVSVNVIQREDAVSVRVVLYQSET